jgi:predicted ATPase
MHVTIDTITPFHGFRLDNEISFEGNICIIIGKNGSGKTRLLSSIQNGNSETKIDGVIVTPNHISLIDIKSPPDSIFNHQGNSEGTVYIARDLIKKINEFDTIDQFSTEHDVNINPYARMGDVYKIDSRRIINNCATLFKKEFKRLKVEELELYLCAHNEIINSNSLNGNVRLNLSQLTINYHKASKLNRLLKFNEAEGDDTTPISNETLLEIIGNESPHILFNNLINELFREKFYVSAPDANTADFVYNPKLKLKSTNEEVKLTDLSAGEKTIFWLAAKTFETYMSSPTNVFGDKKIILIDEPDAHLHPQMIVDFFNCLTFLIEKLDLIFIFNSHSPTTVAICPNENIYSIESNIINGTSRIDKSSKDNAISQLLEGVTQITVDPQNSRQVYVENINDSSVYEFIYSRVKNKSKTLDRNIILNFISAGPNIADSELKKHIISVYSEGDNVNRLIDKINGDGDCQKVIGMVEHLTEAGNKNIRGLIDWDNTKRNVCKEIIIMAEDYAYSIENLIYDPISIYAYLCSTLRYKPDYFSLNENDKHWKEHLTENDNLQRIVDKVTLDILGRDNKHDHKIIYFNGIELHGDREYYVPLKGENGHSLEKKVLTKYGEINKLFDKTSKKPLIYSFISKVTYGLLTHEFFNSKFEDAFKLLQK